ncbi:MAG: alpha/beta fold hydrolase, partial [Chloroflexota bacterium]
MTILLYIFIIILIIAIVFLLGPRVKLDQTLRSIDLPDDLDQYLHEAEAQVPHLRPGTEKKIIWANEAQKAKTPVSVVYLHGYSASRKETYPLSDEIAQSLGANLFYTRLSGHGQNGQALADATVNDWLNDTVEAFEIGRRLGERVLIIGTSTGATLATWLVAQSFSREILATILISPNFGVRAANSNL